MKKADKKPDDGMTKAEAEALCWRLADQLENIGHGEYITDFLLLQRWYAYQATSDDAESVYIKTERDFCVNVAGVEEATYVSMTERRASLKEGGAR